MGASHAHTSTHLCAVWSFPPKVMGDRPLSRADTGTLAPSPSRLLLFGATVLAPQNPQAPPVCGRKVAPECSEPLAPPLKAPARGPGFPWICSSPPHPTAGQAPHLCPLTAKCYRRVTGVAEAMGLAPCSPILLWSSAKYVLEAKPNPSQSLLDGTPGNIRPGRSPLLLGPLFSAFLPSLPQWLLPPEAPPLAPSSYARPRTGM